ncbi:Sulphur transport [Xylophilus ampelinus]|nr:hypothetical protein [Variovorax sp.]VTY25402.1 Sulphur transport [Xylophilus ampelinus]|tara:strand:+ start:46 stop:501 length:456 start_codon:yes stop_codon:yes gene_type:complete
MNALTALLAGLVFGAGLLLSGMADPGKVLGFLDLAGTWDPSLAFVMAGAIAVAAPAFAWVRMRNSAWRGMALQLPTSRAIDRRLMAGSVVFGIGWGLSGFCPGPAVVAVGMGIGPAVVFAVAMLVGMAVFAWWDRQQRVTGALNDAQGGAQ